MAKHITRVVRVEDETIKVGDVVGLVRYNLVGMKRGAHRLANKQGIGFWAGRRAEGRALVRTPRTNMSHEVQWYGWLGTTDDISYHAQGPWLVTALTPHTTDKYWVEDADGMTYVATLLPADEE